MKSHHGLLNLEKPAGITSRRVVDHVQRLAGRAKLGHAGTLDPLASGVLVVGVGAATRLIEYVQRMPKHYRATFLLGRHSPTEDVEGEVMELENPPVPSLGQITSAGEALTGRIEQRPPAYSALKVAGKRAYALARQGRQVDLKPRPVMVYRLDVAAYQYPELELEIECGSGTYVRALGRDLAESLGTAAVMSGLVRTAIGGFRIDEAVDPQGLTAQSWTNALLPLLRAVEGLPRVQLSDAQIGTIRQGQPIRKPAEAAAAGADEIAAVDAAGVLVAILVPRGRGLLGPKRNLPTEG
jgi:tRNA pseudouridine55 synthase